MTMSMYSTTDKMKMSAPSCFPGRYSPSYRSSEQMRRCMPNPSVSNPELIKKKTSRKHND